MKETVFCKKIITGEPSYKWKTHTYEILMYIMYTDMTYEEIRVNVGDSEIRYLVKIDHCTHWKPRDGQYYDIKFLTYKSFINVRAATIGKFTKEEVHNYLNSKTTDWKKIIKVMETNPEKIWNSFNEIVEEIKET